MLCCVGLPWSQWDGEHGGKEPEIVKADPGGGKAVMTGDQKREGELISGKFCVTALCSKLFGIYSYGI
jgi:hypothetical protein